MLPEIAVSSSLRTAVQSHIDARGGGEGYYATPMAGVHVLSSHRRVMANHALYRPSLCIVVQGSKQISVGERTLDYGAMQCLVVSMELPACGRIVEASSGEPFLGITVDIDVSVLRDVAAQLEAAPGSTDDLEPSLFVTDVDERLGDCVLRLLRLADTPDAIPVLQPLVMREIHYWLVSGPQGGEFRKLARPGAQTQRIARAICVLREQFADTLRVERLAQAAGMGLSSFHQHFRTLTAMTPLQFQKQLRLLEARRLMVAEGMRVADAAYRVGYESASQFSREYGRMFGAPPKRDAAILRAQAA